MTRAFVVLNPAAGRGRGGRLAQEIVEALTAGGFHVTVGESEAPGDERRVAREAVAAGWTLVIAAGGDGTVHGVANGMLSAERPAVLGVVPIGTGNDFARLVGAPVGNLRRAAEILIGGVERRFDVGCVGGEYFTNSLGVGFDTEVISQMARLPRLRGFTLYLAAAARSFRAYRPGMMNVVAAGHRSSAPLLLAEVAIGISAGGGFKLTPGADPCDGLFDVCLVRRVSIMQFVRYMPRVIAGTHAGLPPVTLFRTAALSVSTPGRPLVMHLDGEIRAAEGEEVRVTLDPARLRVRCATA